MPNPNNEVFRNIYESVFPVIFTYVEQTSERNKQDSEWISVHFSSLIDKCNTRKITKESCEIHLEILQEIISMMLTNRRIQQQITVQILWNKVLSAVKVIINTAVGFSLVV
jgi:hypothetical protein